MQTPDQWITLNVGGTLFQTYRSTILRYPDSILARRLLNGGFNMDVNGAYCIDREPASFRVVLNFLRHGEVELIAPATISSVMREAHFFNLNDLYQELRKMNTLDSHKSVVESVNFVKADTVITRNELVRILAGTISGSCLRLQGMNFAGTDLSKLDLSGVNMALSDLQDCDLTQTNLHGSNLVGCNLSRAKLINTNLGKADLSRAVMMKTVLCGTNLNETCMVQVDLSDSIIVDSTMANADLSHANLNNTQVTDISFNN